jgi:hypothetical protein
LNEIEEGFSPNEKEPRYAKRGTLVRKLKRDYFYVQIVQKLLHERGALAPDGPVARVLSRGMRGKDLIDYADFLSQFLKEGKPTAHEEKYANFVADLKFSPPSHRSRILKKLMQVEGIGQLPQKGGRPKKRLEDQQSFFIGQLVDRELPAITEGFRKLEQLRLQWPARPDRWARELRARGLSENRLEALKSSKTPTAAACRYVADVVSGSLRYVQNAFAQWKKLPREKPTQAQ